jgi:hypothetical protein
MEFFLPGLAALLIAGLVIFLVLPRLGAPVLAVLSLLLLCYGIYSHYTLFSSEYRFSTWQDRLKFYGPFLIIGALVLAVLGYMGFLFGSKGANALPASNNIAGDAQVVEAANTVGNGALSAVTGITNAVGITNNAKVNQNKGVLTNLGQILNNSGANKTANNKGVMGNLGLGAPNALLGKPNNRPANGRLM